MTMYSTEQKLHSCTQVSKKESKQEHWYRTLKDGLHCTVASLP